MKQSQLTAENGEMFYACPMHPEIRQSTPGICPECGMRLVKKTASGTAVHIHAQSDKHGARAHTAKTIQHLAQLYACPMDPDVISEKPGECQKCGMELVPMGTNGGTEHKAHAGHLGAEQDFRRRFLVTLPFVLLIVALSPIVEKWLGFSVVFGGKEVAMFLIGTFIFFYGGWPFFMASRGELSRKNPAMMTLVAFAITAGYTFSAAATFVFPGESLYWEISTLISVFLLGHWMEMMAVRGATGALAELAKLIPPSAHLVKDGDIVDVHTGQLLIGDRVLIKPGEKVPVDGMVVDGASSVNESMMTGESKPVAKKTGDHVIGGTINQDGSLTVEVSKIGADTALAQIMKLIREAQSSKPNIQLLADRAATVLFYVAVAAGISSFIFWFFLSPYGAIFAATVAVAAIVVACPHALGLAIPTVTSITSTLGAKNGILIKDMKGLEIARKLSYVIFDKTGTLTRGEFGVAKIIVAGAQQAVRDENELLAFAAAVDMPSGHSIARGIVGEAKQRMLALPEAKNFKYFPGKGSSADILGRTVAVGNKKLLEELHITAETSRDDFDKTANTPVYVAVDNRLAGVILLTDMVREESREAIRKLRGMGIKTAMLTGDTQDAADLVGKELGIDTVFAHVLPKEKVEKVKALQNAGNIVAMVGDGVNDAPSLAQSHVGIAIGAGTDVAVESAGIVLIKNNPLDVVKAIALSRKTHRKMVQNLAWATGYNVLAIPIAAGVLYPSLHVLLRPEWAALLMSASSVIVVFNALLLRREKIA